MKFSKAKGLALHPHDDEAVKLLNEYQVGDIIDLSALQSDKGGITDAQRGASHVYFERLAKHLNEQNFPMQAVFSQRPDVDWDMYKVKSLYRDLAFAMYRVESTEKLEPKQVTQVYEKLTHFLATKIGVSDLPEFPSWHKQGE